MCLLMGVRSEWMGIFCALFSYTTSVINIHLKLIVSLFQSMDRNGIHGLIHFPLLLRKNMVNLNCITCIITLEVAFSHWSIGANPNQVEIRIAFKVSNKKPLFLEIDIADVEFGVELNISNVKLHIFPLNIF